MVKAQRAGVWVFDERDHRGLRSVDDPLQDIGPGQVGRQEGRNRTWSRWTWCVTGWYQPAWVSSTMTAWAGGCRTGRRRCRREQVETARVARVPLWIMYRCLPDAQPDDSDRLILSQPPRLRQPTNEEALAGSVRLARTSGLTLGSKRCFSAASGESQWVRSTPGGGT